MPSTVETGLAFIAPSNGARASGGNRTMAESGGDRFDRFLREQPGSDSAARSGRAAGTADRPRETDAGDTSAEGRPAANSADAQATKQKKESDTAPDQDRAHTPATPPPDERPATHAPSPAEDDPPVSVELTNLENVATIDAAGRQTQPTTDAAVHSGMASDTNELGSLSFLPPHSTPGSGAAQPGARPPEQVAVSGAASRTAGAKLATNGKGALRSMAASNTALGQPAAETRAKTLPEDQKRASPHVELVGSSVGGSERANGRSVLLQGESDAGRPLANLAHARAESPAADARPASAPPAYPAAKVAYRATPAATALVGIAMAANELQPAHGLDFDTPAMPSLDAADPMPNAGGQSIENALRAGPGQPVPMRFSMSPEPLRGALPQIVEAVRAGTDGTVDVRLNPAELGRLQITFTHLDGGLSVVVNAERAETQDLVRRHVDLLNQELRSLGYGDVALDFGWQGSHSHEGQRSDSTAIGAASTERVDPLVEAARPGRTTDGGLDIRL